MRLLKQIDIESAAWYTCGGKGQGLIRLIHAGCNTPDALVVEPLDDILTDVYPGQSNILKRAAYHLQVSQETKFAVRSSGIGGEDSSVASFAGQHLTLLNVETQDLPEAVTKVRASFDNSKEYREAMGIEGGEMAVLVQPMVKPIWSGVAFSGSPDTGDPDILVVEATRGLGEPLVSGKVDPEFVYKRHRHDPIEPIIGKRWIVSLAEQVRKAENAFGYPVDCEFAVKRGGSVVMLQARPLTGVTWTVDVHGHGIETGNDVAVGPVHKVRDQYAEDFPEGAVLVTKMTVPSMVDAMIRSCAIVTEIGGRTCHAAIVARELKKPCVVSYPSARFLLDGQIVEVNGHEGTVVQVTEEATINDN